MYKIMRFLGFMLLIFGVAFTAFTVVGFPMLLIFPDKLSVGFILWCAFGTGTGNMIGYGIVYGRELC